MVVVSRDASCRLISTWANQLDHGDSLVREAKVVPCAIKYAIIEGYKKIILEGDVLNVIGPLRNLDCPPHWSIKPFIDDILHFVKFFENVYFSFCF